MTQEFDVSAEELLRTLKRRGIPLPSEIGAFITLEACEHVLDRPAALSTNEVAISEIGEVLCADGLTPSSELEAAKALLNLLGELLVCSAPGVPSMLLDLVERGPSRCDLTLSGLLSDLEACLVPLNRGATRRVLARLVRETRKPGPSQRASAAPQAADLDAQLDALIDEPPARGARSFSRRTAGERTAAPAARKAPAAFVMDESPTRPVDPGISGAAASAFAAPSAKPPRAAAGSGSDFAAVSGKPELRTAAAGGGDPETQPRQALPDDAASASPASSDAQRARAAGEALRAAAVAAREPEHDAAALDEGKRGSRGADDEALAARSVQRKRAEKAAPTELDLDEDAEARAARGRLGLWIFGLSTLAALGLLLIYFTLGRDNARQALGLLPQTPPPPAAKPAAPPKPQVGDLLVTSQPGRAQVLLSIGPGPALATDIPLGVAQEFVAVADGYAPARAVLPADTQWEDQAGQARAELAIQATRATSEIAKNNFGATLLPRDVGTPQARLGTVRIVTTPRGAAVYQLIGFTPDVRVENLPLDRPYEIIVFLEGKAPVRRHLEPTDFSDHSGKRTAELSVALDAKLR